MDYWVPIAIVVGLVFSIWFGRKFGSMGLCPGPPTKRKPDWTYSPSPADGHLYLVKFKSGGINAAFADPDCANGWSNRDTWEDWDGNVIAWKVAK